MNNSVIELKFRKSLEACFDDLILQFPNETDLMLARIFIGDIDIKIIINEFSKRVLPYKTMIKNRDELFFTSADNICKDLGVDYISKIKTLYKSLSDDIESKNIIWRWFDLFVHLTELYSTNKK